MGILVGWYAVFVVGAVEGGTSSSSSSKSKYPIYHIGI
jgi:hypothetical protein